MTSKMFAAIGTDGTKPVVWGTGSTPKLAIVDAKHWARLADADPELFDCVEVTEEQLDRIDSGEVQASTLGIVVDVQAWERGERL